MGHHSGQLLLPCVHSTHSVSPVPSEGSLCTGAAPASAKPPLRCLGSHVPKKHCAPSCPPPHSPSRSGTGPQPLLSRFRLTTDLHGGALCSGDPHQPSRELLLETCSLFLVTTGIISSASGWTRLGFPAEEHRPRLAAQAAAGAASLPCLVAARWGKPPAPDPTATAGAAIDSVCPRLGRVRET